MTYEWCIFWVCATKSVNTLTLKEAKLAQKMFKSSQSTMIQPKKDDRIQCILYSDWDSWTGLLSAFVHKLYSFQT